MSVARPPIGTRPDGAVRVLHTSDWHLGVTVRGHARSDDHRAVIAELAEIASHAQPDLILHTGDLFDGHRPAMADFGLAITALRELSTVAPVAVLAGNHDSPLALDVLAVALEDDTVDAVADGRFDHRAFTDRAVRIHPRPEQPEKGAVTRYPTRAGGELRLVALPFVHQNRVLRAFADLIDTNTKYADGLRKIVEAYSRVCFDDFDPATDVAVFASHVLVRGARTSSEKLIHISEDYATDPAAFDPRYGYLGFGHIHVPQHVSGERGRYAGSILQVDYGEEGESKRVVVADLQPGRPTRITSVPLTTGRPLRRVWCTLAELPERADAIADAFVEVTITVEPDREAATSDVIEVGGIEFDTLSAAVAAALPDAEVVSVIDGRQRAVDIADDFADGAEPLSLEEAFREWLAGPGRGVLQPDSELVDPERIVELFVECHDAIVSGSPAEPREVADISSLLAAEVDA